jgi:hypothetical protein
MSVADTEKFCAAERTRRDDEARRLARQATAAAEAERRAPVDPGAPRPAAPLVLGAPPPPPAPPAAASIEGGRLVLRHGEGPNLVLWCPEAELAALEAVLIDLARAVPAEVVPGTRLTWAERLYAAHQSRVLAEADAGPSRSRPTVVVHAHHSLLTGTGDGEHVATTSTGDPVPADLVRLFACDGRIEPVFDDDEGLIIGHAPAQRFPAPSVRTAVKRRDRTCRFPGCSNPLLVEFHHVVPWAEGGPSTRKNVCLLCWAHHVVRHTRGWDLIGDADHELTWISPEGRRYPSRPPVTPGPRPHVRR